MDIILCLGWTGPRYLGSDLNYGCGPSCVNVLSGDMKICIGIQSLSSLRKQEKFTDSIWIFVIHSSKLLEIVVESPFRRPGIYNNITMEYISVLLGQLL